MDPSIMKLLEDDEDETVHSGADVEAFTAQLNRHIEGDTNVSASQPLEPHNGALSLGNNPTSEQLFSQWQKSSQEEAVTSQIKQEPNNLLPQEQNSSEMESNKHGSRSEGQLQQLEQETKPLPLQQKDDQLQQHAERIIPCLSKPSEQHVILEHDRMRHPDNQQQYPNPQKMNNPQASAPEPSNNPKNRNKQVPFGMLLPVILPNLDKDRAMQLQTLYAKLRKNEINKDGFVRMMRSIVGDQMLRQAVNQIQLKEAAQEAKAQSARDSQTGSQQLQVQSQTSHPQYTKMPPMSVSPLTDSHSFSQFHQKGQKLSTDPAPVLTATVQVQNNLSFPATEGNTQKSREMEHLSDSQGLHASQVSSSNMGTVNQERELSTFSSRGLNKQHLNMPHTTFSMYGSVGNFHGHAYSGPSATSLKHQSQESHMRHAHLNQSMVSMPQGGTTQPMSISKYDVQNLNNESKRLHGGPHGGPHPHLTNHSMLQHNPTMWQPSMSKEQKASTGPSVPYVKQEILDHAQDQQHKSQFSAPSSSAAFSSGQADQVNPTPRGAVSVSSSLATPSDPTMQARSQVLSTTTSLGPGTNVKTPAKKPSIGQKKPLDALGTPPPTASKKQKVSGAFLDQSIEQLNDVTAVSGVNLREEEEQLLSGPKEESRASEATRRVVQEEEERLILQKAPLQKTLFKIMSKCGIKSISNDVERCLSLCVEERMRGIISSLIRVSKQRVDIEKSRHRTLITSDVRRQILLMNRKAKEDWERKQAEEAEKVRKLNEADGNTATDGEKDKDEGRTKNLKANKEEDDKMRTTAANVAARAAVGGDDMLSKWQLMAEQARQKREGGVDMASAAPLGKDVSRRTSTTSGRSTRDNHDAENRALTTASGRKFGRTAASMPQKITRTISLKDVITVLEREPQTSKSTLVYRLYERGRTGATDATTE